MKKFYAFFLILSISFLAMGMAHRGVYDEEARETERLEKKRKKFADKTRDEFRKSGKEAGDVTAEGEEAAEEAVEAKEEEPGTTGEKIIRTATFGVAKSYEVQPPEQGKDEPTKFKLKF